MELEALALGVEVSVDRMHTAIVAAAMDGHRVAVELLEYLDGSDTAGQVAELAGRPDLTNDEKQAVRGDNAKRFLKL